MEKAAGKIAGRQDIVERGQERKVWCYSSPPYDGLMTTVYRLATPSTARTTEQVL